MSPALRCLKVTVSGHVQGVCFRHYTRQTALQLAITGWVKNLPDGRVQALICGDPAAIDAMLAWLAHGPESARVTGCTAEPTLPDTLPDNFSIVY